MYIYRASTKNMRTLAGIFKSLTAHAQHIEKKLLLHGLYPPIHAVFPLLAALYTCFGLSNLEAGLIICIIAVLLGGLLTVSKPCAVRFHEN